MRIVVVGTGGVGGYFGARLAQAGEQVTFIARGKHLQAIQTNGLQVYSVVQDMWLEKVQATDDPTQVGIADAILVSVKAWQVPEVAQMLQPMMGPETFVVPLQNGVEAPAQLAQVLGEDAVLGGLCWIVSFIEAPGIIRHTGVEPHVVFGELDNRRSQRVERLYQAFSHAEIKVEIPQDVQAAMWEKFIFITSMSGMGAITRVPVGIMRNLPQTRQMIEHTIDEIIAVGWEHQVRLTDDVFDRTMAFIDNMPPESTLSMQRDIMEGRPSELESQNGAVVRLGKEVNVTTPLNTFIYHSLLPLELQARGEL
jgi:2-dehydropantoate 2-reductase